MSGRVSSMLPKDKILAIVGKLQFCARVVRAGTMFVRRLINCAKKLKNLHHVVRLCAETRKGLGLVGEVYGEP